MNGARTIFRRKGYFSTALAAAVLLAASSGTAWAQTLSDVTLTLVAPRTVAEGADQIITVRGTATVTKPDVGVADVPNNRRVTVNLVLAPTAKGENADPLVTAELGDLVGGQVNDAQFVTAGRVTLTFAANSGDPRERSDSGTVVVGTNHDPDSENEGVVVMLADTDGVTVGSGPAFNAEDSESVTQVAFTIDDDETQTYVLTLDTRDVHRVNPPLEGGEITANIEAKPAHFDNGEMFTLHVVGQDGKRLLDYSAMGEESSAGSGALGTVNPMGGLTAVALDNSRPITISQTHPAATGDGNRVTDTITLEAYSGSAGSDKLQDSLDIDVLDNDGLPAGSAITAVAKDEDGKVVTEVMEGGDPVYLTLTVDRGKSTDLITNDELTVDIRAADGAQLADYDLSESRVPLEALDSGKQSNDIDTMIKLLARSDEDVGAENLVLNLVVSGDSKKGAETSTGTFSIAIVDNTTTKVAPKTEAEAKPKIMAAMEAGAGDDGDLNPGESFTVMTSDLFTVTKGYTAAYGVSVDGDSVSISTSSDSITVDAKQAGESEVTVTATAKMESSSFDASQTVSDVARITFPVTVVDKALVVTVAADPAEIMEGGTSTITATANRAVEAGDGAVQIDLEVVGDATLDANSITIAAGAMSGSAMLTAAEDDNYADETVTVVATGSGIDAARQVAIAVMDNDEAPVEPEPGNTIEPMSEEDAYPVITGAIEMGAGDEGLNPGESFEVMASALFTVMEGYTASYSASVDNGDVASTSVSGDSVTVMAAAAGEAKVTISGTSRMASSSFAPEQVDTNMADITFLVTVVDKPLAALVVMLEMPANVMDGNIVEGESYEIMVSANRMVTEDTEVMIMRDRAASDAGEDDFEVSSATIMAGYDSATAELMVTEDMEPDSGTNDNMGESLVLYGMANGEETNSLTFTIWDTAVPALPLFGQLLLALFLMLGGARLYRRRQG